jgi:hypothetical protein
VIAEAKCYWAAHRTSGVERLSFPVRDMLASTPQAQDERDIYLLVAVLHGFDDDTCLTVLGSLASGSTGARVALLEMVLPEFRPDLTGASFDMQMFLGSRDRERALTEWISLFDRGGMTLEELVGLRSFGNILVLRPKKSV